MYKKIAVVLIAGALLVTGVGCSKKDDSANQATNQTQTSSAANSQLPAGHPSLDGANSGQAATSTAKPIKGEEVEKKIADGLDKKFPGEWSASGTNLKKGSYTETGNFKIVDEVAQAIYPGSMVSLFIGDKRVSSSITDNTGKRVLEGYPTPDDVPATMKSGKIKVTDGGAMGASNFQKIYLPLKSGDKTVAVMTISVAQ